MDSRLGERSAKDSKGIDNEKEAGRMEEMTSGGSVSTARSVLDGQIEVQILSSAPRESSSRSEHLTSGQAIEVSNPLSCSIFTCNYANYKPEMGLAVRITMGKVPSWFPYPYVVGKSLKPFKTFRSGLPLMERRDIYMAELDRHEGWVWSELEQFSKISEGQPLILLCFEKIVTGFECHRRWAADWFATKGVDVPDLPLKLPPTPKPIQETLF